MVKHNAEFGGDAGKDFGNDFVRDFFIESLSNAAGYAGEGVTIAAKGYGKTNGRLEVIAI